MTDFIQKKIDQFLETFEGELYLDYRKDNPYEEFPDAVKLVDFLRQALIEQHNRTVEECAEALKVEKDICQYCETFEHFDEGHHIFDYGFNEAVEESRTNILNLKK